MSLSTQNVPMTSGYVYIMTNRSSGTLYIGVTANIAARVTQHREASGSDFCRNRGARTAVTGATRLRMSGN